MKTTISPKASIPVAEHGTCFVNAAFGILLLCLFSLPAWGQHSSDILFEEDWSGCAEGSLPKSKSAWKFVIDDRGSIAVTETPSPFGTSTKALKIEHTIKNNWGPRATCVFPSPVNEAITVAFDFLLDGKSDDQPTFKLEGAGDSPVAGLWLALDNHNFPTSIPGSNIVNRLNDGAGNSICPVSGRQWYHVVLEVAKPSEGKFNIVVTPEGGTPVRVDGLAFRAPLQEFEKLSFITNTTGGSGILCVSNIRVSAAKK